MTSNQAVALIVKYANDFGVLNSKVNIKLTDKWIKDHIPNNSQKIKK
jgi:hypothetical protein